MSDGIRRDSAPNAGLDAIYADGVAHLGPGCSPEDAKRGFTLVETAAARGHPAAAEMIALFEAMGVGRVQSWPKALHHLQRAAELGSISAQRQLLLLRDPHVFPEGNPQPAPERWLRAGNGVDLAAALRVGEPVKLCEAPRIRVIRGFATAAECQWLIERALERLQRAAVMDEASGNLAYHPGRTNSAVEFPLGDMDIILALIRERIAAATRLPVPLFEPTQILHYAVGEEFRPHYDFIDPGKLGFQDQLSSGQRIATFLIYLNSEYAGGATHFPMLNLAHKGETGDAFFFANVGHDNLPEPNSLHAGQAPTSGQKWILSQWIRDRARPASDGAGE